MRLAKPMAWWEPYNREDDYYFCNLNLKGINRKNRQTLIYPNLVPAIRPVPHREELPVPVFNVLPQIILPPPKKIHHLKKRLEINTFQMFSQVELKDLGIELSRNL